MLRNLSASYSASYVQLRGNQPASMFSPFVELRVNGAQVRNFDKKCDIWVSRKEPADVAEFELKTTLPELGLAKNTPIELYIGYDLDKPWKVFAGYITEPRDPLYMAKDEAVKLFRTKPVQTLLNVTPQDVIKFGLRQAGIAEFQLSEKTFLRKPRFVIAGENVSDLIRRVNATWNIDYDWFFDAEGKFYWDDPASADGPVYSYRYGENIIELDFGTDREPSGQRALGNTTGLGRLLTVVSPFITHSQEIEIIWPEVGDRRFMVETVHHFRNEKGSLRTEIFFREI
jgi:hypothetical protein